MKEQLMQLIETLEKSYVTRLEGSDLIESYYEGDDFYEYSSGNFDDDVDLGNRIGSYEVASEVIGKLKAIIEGETK